MADNIKCILMKYVNCYLIDTGSGFILIDTGIVKERKFLDRELIAAGCKPGNLKLVIITHGDTDHTGNGAWLRAKYGAKLALHPDDSPAAETGSMLACRGKVPFLMHVLLALYKLPGKDRFKADIFTGDGYDFSAFGFNAKVHHIPGHTRGSIAILTGAGALFCGDLLGNRGTPEMTGLIYDLQAANNSLEKLKSLGSAVVYPGHGAAFAMNEYVKRSSR